MKDVSKKLAAHALSRCWNNFRWPLILLVVYFASQQLYVSLAVDDGVFFPVMAGERIAMVAFGVLVVVLRLLVCGVLPIVIVYKLAMALVSKKTESATGKKPPAG